MGGNINGDATETVVVGARPQARMLTLWNDGFLLNAWYYSIDDGEKMLVPVEWLSDDRLTIQPTEASAAWVGKTIYVYAEVIPATRRFQVTGFTTTANDPQAFVFNLKGVQGTPTADIDLTFFIFDNGHLDIEQLPYGQYTLTTLSWAWRYGHPQSVRIGEGSPLDATSGSVTLNLNTTDEVVITYSSNNKKTQWLSDDVAGVIPTTPVQTPGQS